MTMPLFLSRVLILIASLFGLASTGWTAAPAPNSYCPTSFEEMPILAGGRVKPLRVHAKDVVKFISGKTTCGDLSATEEYCFVSLEKALNMPSPCPLQIRVDHQETRELLGMGKNDAAIEPEKAKAGYASLQSAYAQLQAEKKEKTGAGKDIAATLNRIELYFTIQAGADWQIPVFYDNKTTWVTVRDLHEIRKDSFADPALMRALFDRLHGIYDEKVGEGYRLELVYDKLSLFAWALALSIIALGINAVARPRVGALLFASVAPVFLVEIAAIAMRVVISGRGPVTNMYETVVWVGLGTLLFAAILSAVKREKIYILAGLMLNSLCLVMVTFAHNMLDPSISPLVPVLRDNFWLSTHVTTITISYAAFALSWGLANYFMLRTFFSRTSSTDTDTARISDLIYAAIKIGVVLIAVGLILGGIWADYSWGRFWGWDPKETWALIVLLTYIAILHGRHAGWIRNDRFIPLVAAAFLTVLMAWFGVNFILATGLHSYGFSQGGTFFIVGLVVVQLTVLGAFLSKNRKSNPALHDQ